MNKKQQLRIRSTGFTNGLDMFLYIGLCICTFGLVEIFRLTITQAIKRAFEDE